MLRPVGTEFWYQFPMQENSTQPYASRFLYRVVAHSSIKAGGVVKLAEELKPIKMEKQYPSSVRFCECGRGLIYDFPATPPREEE